MERNSLSLTDDTLTMLSDSVAAYCARGRKTAFGLARQNDQWQEIGEQGWLSVLVPADLGGLGLGLAHAAVIARELGRAAQTLPFVAALMANSCVSRSTAASALIESLSAGRLVLAPAWDRPGFETAGDGIRAEAVDRGYALSGRMSWVQIPSADAFLVLARGASMVGLFRIWRAAPGVVVETSICADGTTVGQLRLNAVRVESTDLLSKDNAAVGEIERANLVGLNLCGAELLGLMDGALDMTLNYLRTRVQFGVPIGSLQVLQHRAVDLWIRRQVTEAAVLSAIAKFDDSTARPLDCMKRALGAKLRASQAALSLSTQALQLHGAVGFAEEYGLGAYVNRVLKLAAWLGNGADLRTAYADVKAVRNPSSGLA